MMQSIAAWNIRGAHQDFKLDQIKQLIQLHNLSLISISETKLNSTLSSRAAHYINPAWNYLDNLTFAPYGRILILYNPSIYSLTHILSTNQLIYTRITHIPTSTPFFCTFIYAENSVAHRQHLFNLLPHFRQESHPWLVVGDFNSSYLSSHKVGGPPLSAAQLSPLNIALHESSLIEIPFSGSQFTWTNKCRQGTRTLTKLIMLSPTSKLFLTGLFSTVIFLNRCFLTTAH